jgi:hypothetical protein
MPGPLLTILAAKTCSHGGMVTTTTTNKRVFADGLPVATITDQVAVVGCPFTTPVPKPQPCVRIVWSVPSTRVFVNGQPALLGSSLPVGLSVEQIPQGSAVVVPTQKRSVGI